MGELSEVMQRRRRFRAFLWAALSVAAFGGCGTTDKTNDVNSMNSANSAKATKGGEFGAIGRSLAVVPKDGVRRAVLVAVNDYARFPDLRFAGADVELMRTRLLELGFAPENIVALTTQAGRENERFAPNKTNIELELERILAESGPDDMIFVMFTGHGFQTENYGGYKDYVGFAPSDAAPNRATVVDFASTVSLSKLFDDLEASAAKFKWVLVDACRENLVAADDKPISKSLPRSKALRKLDAPPGVAILQSCGEGEFSWENPESGHGVFTQFFAESLTEVGDANEDGVVTFWEATTRACKAVASETSNSDLYETKQTPRLSGNMTDFVLADVNTAKAKERCEAAVKAREAGRYATALKEIDAALKLAPTRAEYGEEKARIEREKTAADANRFASEAWKAYNKNGDARTAEDVAEAVSLMTESLAVLENELNRNALRVFETELKRLGASPVVDPTSTTETSSTAIGQTSTEAGAPGGWADKYKAGTAKSLTIKGEEYKFHYCPAGEFLMGSPESEPDRYSNEKQHRVELTNGFWMLETEVTQAMWESAMGTKPMDKTWLDGWKSVKKPVGNVSWEDCQDFIAKLNSLGVAPSGFQFRLPTEAEWEYACRAGTSGPYAGSGLDSLGWCEDNSDGEKRNVGEKRANAWGLRDMHGNVYEWCCDWFAAYTHDAETLLTNPTGPSKGASRVLRGGAWDSDAEFCRSAYRNRNAPSRRYDNYGLRLVLGCER